jgi:hypothetical protein
MTQSRRDRTRQPKATPRRLQKARARLQREQARAQRDREALEPAIRELGLPETVVEAVEGRLRAQGQRLSQIFGVRFPPLVGCRTADERSRVRGGDQHGPTRLLGPCPSARGGSAGSRSAEGCWYGGGGRWRTTARPPAVAGRGRG